VLFYLRAAISSSITKGHSGCLMVDLNPRGSLTARCIWNHNEWIIWGLTILFLAWVTIGWLVVGGGREEEKEEAEGMVSTAIVGDEGCNESSEGGKGMCESVQGTHE